MDFKNLSLSLEKIRQIAQVFKIHWGTNRSVYNELLSTQNVNVSSSLRSQC